MAPLSKKVIAWVAAGIATATLVLTVVLWWAGTAGLTADKLVAARLDALRTGLSVGLGGGGLFALYLAWRRQHSTEIGLRQKERDQADVARAYELQREDSLAKRITELYTKSVEQLGSDKAPVRLGGLYALERLAQDHVEQRQTIVNVLCAYLRMPFTLPRALPSPEAVSDQEVRKGLVAEHRESVQEREVRLTAQRILAHHLAPGGDSDNPDATFWSDIDVDLTSTILINLDLAGCRIRKAQFDGATFIGRARFDGATFTGRAWFFGATFADTASFYRTIFTGDAGFIGATFADTAWFEGTTFTGDAGFNEATFTDAVGFSKATFTNTAWFNGVTFADTAWFGQATFSGTAEFRRATFTGNAQFDWTTFTHEAWFAKATFTGNASFHEATFTGKAWFGGADLPRNLYVDSTTPSPWSSFAGARFEQRIPPVVAQFVSQLEGQSYTGDSEE